MKNRLSQRTEPQENLTDRIARLSPAKRALLELKLKKSSGPSGERTIPRRANRESCPLSFSQQRLWFLDQLEPESPLYNTSKAIRLSGALNVEALQKSLDAIVARHEILRTNIVALDGNPIQVITKNRSVKLAVIDLSEWADGERQAEMHRLLNAEALRPFDLSSGLMLRTTLLRLGENDHVLLLLIHHIASDGWSMGILSRELAALYGAFSTGKPYPLPELPIQYADFAVWQRQWFRGEVLETQLSYWRKQLDNLATLQLPTDRPRPAIQSFRGARQTLALPKDLSVALKALSRKEGVTLFMTLLAAFQTLLHRYAGQEDIAVGTDVANRNRVETEGLIGFFVNLLVMRTNLSGNPTFRELLRRVREMALGGYAHQDVPFERLVEELRPERDLSRNPLVQVLFVMQNAPVRALELSGLTLSPLEVGSNISRFDLGLFMTEQGQGLVMTWNYSTDLFGATTIDRMIGHFETLLGSIVAQPDTRLKALPMVSEAERSQQAMEKRTRHASNLSSFKKVIPKAVDLSQVSLVKTDYLQPGGALPLVVQPGLDDVDLVEWAKANTEFIARQLSKHGAILFRGFSVSTVSQFENFALAICPELFGEYGDLPREGAGGKVYESTPYPPDQAILFHNESSHMHRWPMKQWFFCVQAARQMGETPIVDCRKVYQFIDAKILEPFAQKGIVYVRNFTDKLDVSWQDFFKTTDRSVVENFCRNASIDFEWRENNDLRIRQVCPAVARHPKTGEMVWFNQLQHWHLSCLDRATRESLLSLFREQDLPRNCYYGDGSAIEDSVMEEISEVYRKTAVSFPWQQGDILMVDNMLVAHGRNPYVGARKIVVAMGEMISKEEL